MPVSVKRAGRPETATLPTQGRDLLPYPVQGCLRSSSSLRSAPQPGLLGMVM